ncbi:MAG TPA: exo-alpha-sialidase [Thermoplasmata archaeon]
MAAIKKGDTVVLVGTRKGLFLFHSRDRRRWQSRGPYFEGQTIRHAILDPRDGKTVYAGATSEHWGSTVARTTNFGGSWDLGKEGPRYSKESGLTVTRIWQIQPGADGDLYAGVEPAGLFRSEDGGATWASVEGLNYRPDREKWDPGAGGLCLHTVLPYPGEPKRMLVGISSSGVFGTSDGGATWREMNGGVRKYEGGGSFEDGKIGTCPHKIVRDARDPAILYMQNHVGVYRRARGDPQWTVVEDGLPKIEKKVPASFGFPIAAHPHDAGTAYAVPLEGDYNRVTPRGAMAVYRTRNGGKRWQRLSRGLPQKDAWFTILRDALRTDDNDPAGVYVGTTTGQLYASRNEGDSWRLLADHLNGIQSVEAGTVGGR